MNLEYNYNNTLTYHNISKMWLDLFYDKFARNHGYNNRLTKDIVIEDFNDGSYTLYINKQAHEFFHKKFPDQILPKFLVNSNMYKLRCYTKFDNISRIEFCVRFFLCLSFLEVMHH